MSLSDTILRRERHDNVSLSGAGEPKQSDSSNMQVDGNCFAFTPGQLNDLFNPKSLTLFCAFGGLQGLENGLRTDIKVGLQNDETVLPGSITSEEAKLLKTQSSVPLLKSRSSSSYNQAAPEAFHDRKRVFGCNVLPQMKRKGFGRLLWDAYNDKIIILLTVAAVISLSLGIYEAVSGQSRVDWIEGVAVCVAILIVVSATAGNDWKKEREFVRLNRLKVDRLVKVVRSGNSVLIHINDITVGDVVHLEPGDCAPADGIIISNYGLKCDESMATGESDQIEKQSGDVVWNNLEGSATSDELDPFIISGSKVLEGLGTYLVLSVGPNSTYGQIFTSLETESDPTPLQVKLGRLASWIGWFGLGAALLLFFVLLIRFLAQLPENDAPSTVKGQEFMDILIVTVTVIVVAIPEGLPLAVTLALAFAMGRMLKENNLVRQLRACETMGNATVICSDKTGTLTQNKMTAVAGFFGLSESFGQLPTEQSPRSRVIEISEALARFPTALKDVLTRSIVANSTAFSQKHGDKEEFVGNKTEVALLELAQKHLGVRDITRERSEIELTHIYPFDSTRKAMAVVYRLDPATDRVLVKGAAEVVLSACTTTVIPQHIEGNDMPTANLEKESFEKIQESITAYAGSSLRTIGLAYLDLPTCSTAAVDGNTGDPRSFDDIFKDFTWIGMFGIHDPLRPEVTEAIQKCRTAGVQVKMITGDNVNTALSIAISCGIKTDDGIAIEAPQLRNLSETELDTIIPRLQVVARSSPKDKQLIVKHLKRNGEIVAVTGDGTNDGPALRSADVGFSMGLSGTEVAREASSIVLLDDNFTSIVTAIAWGRCVNDAVAKFLQFQITVNITAVCLTVVTAIYSSSNESVFKAVQLLWLNLIMDTFAALALATDPPSQDILQRPPTPRNAPLFTVIMWKMIIGQSIYKLALCFTLYFAGNRILNYDPNNAQQQLELDTIIFNTFVWMQIFNEFNCRRLDNRINVFQGIYKNSWFLIINVLMIAGQILIIFVGGEAFSVTRLDGTQWAICIGCAVVCIPWAVALKFIPDCYFSQFLDIVSRILAIMIFPLSHLYRITAARVERWWQHVSHFLSRKGPGNHSRTDEEMGNTGATTT